MFKMKKGFGKFLGLLVALSMVIASGTYNKVSAAPVVLTDIAGHWAEAAIQSAVDNGYISGYNGKFNPEDPMTRGQFASMVNRAFGFTKKASLNFTDMKDGSQWYYEPVQVAVAAGFMVGYDDNTFRPLNNMTWAQCITVYVNLLGFSENKAAAQNITNYSSFQNKWYAGNVGSAYANGILDSKVMKNGAINPDENLTRAEAAYMLSIAYALKNGGSTPGTITELADKFVVPANATFGPANGVQTVTKNVSVTGSGALLQNLDIRGNLTIETSVGDGDVYLKGVTVTGTTTILAGGPNSIRAVDSQFSTINLNDSNGNVRFLLEGTSRATTVNVNSGGTLTAANLTGTGFGTVNVTGSTSTSSPLNINANVTSLNVSSYGSYVNVNGGVVSTATIASTGTNSILNLTSSATVSSFIANTSASVYGRVNQATLNTSGVYLSQTPGSLTSGSYSPATSPNTSGSSTNITLSPSSLTFNSSNASGVTFTATLNNAIVNAGQSVVFTSSDASFVTLTSGSYTGQSVTVTPSGNVAYVTARLVASSALVAANIGKTVTITASYGGYTQSTNVTIGGTANSLITFSPSTVTFNSSNYNGVYLSAAIGSSIVTSGQYVTFTSSDPTLVTLTSGSYNGASVSVLPSGNTAYVTAALTNSALLTTHNGRSVTITANYGGYTQSMVVYINTAATGSSSLAASPSSITLSENNMGGVNLTATTNSVITTSTPMVFSIADPSLATVSYGTSTGQSVSVLPTGTSAVVTVKPTGSAETIIANKGKSTTLTITYGTYTQTVPISISNTARVVDVTLSGDNYVAYNGTITLKPTFIFSNGTTSNTYSGSVQWYTTGNCLQSLGNGSFKGIAFGTGVAGILIAQTGYDVIDKTYSIDVGSATGAASFSSVPSTVTVNRITDFPNGRKFEITLAENGTHTLKMDYDSANYTVYRYTKYGSSYLTQVPDNSDFSVDTSSTNNNSRTVQFTIVPNAVIVPTSNSIDGKNSIISISGSYINTATPPVTKTYNARSINVAITPVPVLSVDKDSINTKDGVFNVTISDPAASGTLTIKAFKQKSTDPVDYIYDEIRFGTSQNYVAQYTIPVNTTAGTATTIPVTFSRKVGTDPIYLSAEYTVNASTVKAELQKQIELKVGQTTTSPELTSILINGQTVNLSGDVTFITEPLYTNGKLPDVGVIYANGTHMFSDAKGDWSTAKNTAADTTISPAVYTSYDLNSGASYKYSLYIWPSSSSAAPTDTPKRYQIVFTNVSPKGFSSANLVTINEAQFSGVPTLGSYDTTSQTTFIRNDSIITDTNGPAFEITVAHSNKSYTDTRVQFQGPAGTSYSVISCVVGSNYISGVGINGNELLIPASVLNNTGLVGDIVITVRVISPNSAYQSSSYIDSTIKVVRKATVSLTSSYALITLPSPTINPRLAGSTTLGGVSGYTKYIDSSISSVNVTAIKTSSNTYNNITLSFAQLGLSFQNATVVCPDETTGSKATISSSGDLTIYGSQLTTGPKTYTITTTSGGTITVYVTPQ